MFVEEPDLAWRLINAFVLAEEPELAWRLVNAFVFLVALVFSVGFVLLAYSFFAEGREGGDPAPLVPDAEARLRAASRSGADVPALPNVSAGHPRLRRDSAVLQDAATDERRARLARIQKGRVWW